MQLRFLRARAVILALSALMATAVANAEGVQVG